VDRSRLSLTLGQRFARLVTNAVVRLPAAWRLFRGPFRKQFDRLAPSWEGRRRPDSLVPFEHGLGAVRGQPRRILDLGTGTGIGARIVAERFPEAEVVGVDLAAEMVAEARRVTPPELLDRIRYETADAAHLPYEDGAFDLVTLANMIPFFGELARVVTPGGTVVVAFSAGAGTPIYVSPERIRRELGRRGFDDFQELQAARGTALVARKLDSD
jgi:SAM-dependent methyltransferase